MSAHRRQFYRNRRDTDVVVLAGPIDKLPYVDYPTIEFNASESVEMPFRYVKDSQTGLPTMPKGMKELLERDMDKGFEDFEV